MNRTELVVLIPSRGRPESFLPLMDAFEETCTADTNLLFVVDDNDPRKIDYDNIWPERVIGNPIRHGGMVSALNFAASLVCASEEHSPYAVGFMGDDHMPRTKGWDTAYLEALRELGSGIVYGDDLLQGRNLPTQCAMTADIVRTLGFMAPPTLKHMYVDNYWKQLGEQAECLRYLPSVVVEHLHPLAGKAEWDSGYRRVNDSAVYARDRLHFEDYITSGRLENDAKRVRALRD